MSFEAAATVSMCSMTAAQAVFTRFGLPSPFFLSNWHDKKLHEDDETVNVFVYGASTSLGLYIAQLVRLSFATSRRKLRLLGAASPSKHEFLRQSPYSYDVLVDYRDPAWADSVRDATKGKGIAYAFDAISEGETVSKTHSTLAEDAHFAVFRGPVGGRYDPDKMRIKPRYGAVWVALGETIEYNGKQPFHEAPKSPLIRILV
jgi:NADPH:quinone reductase-like Zn-dependent oxidoreductase